MRYTYQGKHYPQSLSLHNREVYTTLSKDPADITRRDFDHLQDLPLDELTADEENLILWELGRQWGKDARQLRKDATVNPHIIRNTLITLLTSFDESSFDVVLEILRQKEDIIDYNLPDYNGFTYILPMLAKIFECAPERLTAFMQEEGITARGKQMVADLLGRIGSDSACCDGSYDESYKDRVHAKLVAIFTKVLDAYAADGAYADDGSAPSFSSPICDKSVVTHTAQAAIRAGLTELSARLRTLSAQGRIAPQVLCTPQDFDVPDTSSAPLPFTTDLGDTEANYIETSPYPLMFLPLSQIWTGNAVVVD